MLSRTIFPDTSPLRRSIIATAALGFAAFIWIVLGAAPAVADEFTVGVVADPGLGAAYLEGFQLAVDQSPDVSHAAGTEGGDHLGSMDVNIVAVVDVAEFGELIDAAIDMVERSGAAIVVADVPPEVLGVIHGPITSSGTMLIATAGTSGVDLASTPSFFAAADRARLEELLTDRLPAFEEAFAAAYGVSPSDAAARGYLAGRLVDEAVGATDRDPSDVEALAAGLVAATGSVSLTPVGDGDQRETAPSTTVWQEKDETGGRDLSGALMAIGIVAFVGVAGLAYGVWNCNRATTRSRVR
jgi:hypothetical protein